MRIPMPPKLTQPLTKAIRTFEALFAAAIAAVLAAGAIVDPNALPPKVAAKWAAVLAIATLAQRGLIKVAAIQKGASALSPVMLSASYAGQALPIGTATAPIAAGQSVVVTPSTGTVASADETSA